MNFKYWIRKSSPKDSLPLAPSLSPTLESAHMPKEPIQFGIRSIYISLIAMILGIAAGFIAQILTRLIGLITNLSFYGKWSTNFSSPAGNQLGLWVILVPIAGAVIVGFIARYGSMGIRGHGIPEAMEQVLLNESKIPPRLTFLKPLSAAVSIGTGGPFGAEGPIIATGGALGSLIGQLFKTNSDERKILLAAGAAAGMAATFGSPVSAVLIAVELLLFEFKPQSLISVALACVTATSVRIFYVGFHPIFAMKGLTEPGGLAMLLYLVLGIVIGVCSVFVTRAVYAVEDGFEKLPIHWMWWPAIGAVAVGVVGYFAPKTMGVGYDNIENILSGNLTGQALLVLFTLKFISWAISLGSGTSGGTLAPLFTIGGGLGAFIGSIIVTVFPSSGIDVRVAALVGMAAMFAGSARALLTSIVFAFETTMAPLGLLPLLAGCSASYLISSLMMKNTIMTEKIVRRGIRVPNEYEADYLSQITVKECASYDVVKLNSSDTLGKIRAWFKEGGKQSSHHGFPVVNENEMPLGVVSKKDILNSGYDDSTLIDDLIKNPLVMAYEDNTISEAANLMAEHELTRLPIVSRKEKNKIVAVLSRSDILKARKKKINEIKNYQNSLNIKAKWKSKIN